MNEAVRPDAAVCPLCGAEPSAVAYSKRLAFPDTPDATMDLLRCGGCGVLFAWPMPAPERLALLYQDPSYFDVDFSSGQRRGNYEDSAEFYTERARQVDADFRRWGQSPGRLIEFGAAGGHGLAAMRALGWSVEGVEASTPLRERAMARYGLRLADSLESLTDSVPFDAACMTHVLEHLSDAPARLQHLLQRMHPGGLVRIEVPSSLNSPIYRSLIALHRLWPGGLPIGSSMRRILRLTGRDERLPPYHVYEFHLRSLVRLVENAGAAVLEGRGQMPRPDPIYSAPTGPARRIWRAGFDFLNRLNRLGLGIHGNLILLAQRRT